MAVDIQHFAPQLIERINSFFGYQAVARLKLIHAVRPNRSPRGPSLRPLSAGETAAIDAAVSTLPDQALAETLARFGRTLAARETR